LALDLFAFLQGATCQNNLRKNFLELGALMDDYAANATRADD
jgi:hypothetical protein